jgi:flagellar hook-associated protein 2
MSGNGAYNTLQSIGISMQNDGTLSIDSSTLNSALTSNFTDLANLFQGAGSFGENLGKTMASLNSPTTGALAMDLNSVQQTNQDLTNQINDFEARLTAQQQFLTNQYSLINAELQALPGIQNQISAMLGSLDPYTGSSSSSKS